MSSVVADTHAFIWYLLSPNRLSQTARDTTALILGLPLVTRDGKIRASNITTIW